MAFSFGGTPPAAAAGGNAQSGPDLPEIQTEASSARIFCYKFANS